MGIKYEVLARGETYTDKTGAEKVRWIKCGVIMDTKSGGMALKLESLPIVSDGWFSLFPPKDDREAAKPAPAKAVKPDAFDDDILDF